MTKEEVKKLKLIISTVQDAYFLINKATIDKEADIEFIFGTSTKPNWAPEDHVHVGASGMIIDIRPSSDGIRFRGEHWVNCFGHRIYALLKNTHRVCDTFVSRYYKRKNKEGKKEWAIEPIWVNSYSEPYLVDNVVDVVVRYLLDNFDIVKIKTKTNELKRLRAEREFGFDLKNPYYKIKKDENGKTCGCRENPEFDED